jgi:hypothetical protein
VGSVDRVLLERLTEHQQMIGDITGRAQALLQEKVQPDPMALSRLRWELMRAMTAYQQFKHREIFDPAIKRGEVNLQRMATAMKTECIAIGDALTRYVQHWSSTGTADRWPEYRAAAMDMSTRLRQHVEREGQAIPAMLRDARAGRSTVWPVRAH